MNGTSRAALLGAALIPLLLVPPEANAQGGLLKRIGKKIEQKVDERIDRRTDQAAEKIVDGAEGAVVCAATDRACIERAEKEGKPVVDREGKPIATGTAALKPGEGVWANYDFVPGERILFADDFAADRVGNFPQRMEFLGGNAQVVEWRGRRWLSGEDGELSIHLSEALPERFTVEFDLVGHGNPMQINLAGGGKNEKPYIEIDDDVEARFRGGVDARGDLRANTGEAPVAVRIAVDGDYLKLYVNEHRALNIPSAKMARGKRVYLFLNGWSADQPRMIANVRIAAGGREMYDALAADGRVSTQGILFDTGSDRIRPESTPTLKEITEMLRRHPELRIAIEGHTDNVGDARANQSLSEKRAAAVVAYLEGQGIDGARLQSRGLGASKPAASNETPEGRQQNRRVELVRR